MPATRAYRSKIGRLPFAVRNEVCERMRDGATGPQILEWINQHSAWRAVRRSIECDDINAQNLTDWRTSGYEDWLKDQERTDHIRKLSEFADTVATRTGGDPSAVGARIVAGRLLDVLETADESTAQELVKAFTALRAAENDAQRTVIARDKNDIARKALSLEQDKFRRQTCELFLKWHADRHAAEIAAGPGTNEQKIAALLAYMDKEEAAT